MEHAPRTERIGELERPDFRVQTVAEGLDFGSGTISGKDCDPYIRSVVFNTVHHNPQILIPIGLDDEGHPIDDDGCGDGRAVKTVFSLDRVYKNSLDRAKVFGGATTMTMAIIVGTGNHRQAPLIDVFDAAIDELEINHLNYGAHTDEHAHGRNCGCGAIDRAPEGIAAVLKYKEPITKVIAGLGIDTAELPEVFANFGHYVSNPGEKGADKYADYAGTAVMDKIVHKAKIVKQLADIHKERRIVLNMVPGYTVNQGLVREMTEDDAQIFAVDVWRLQEIAAKTVGEDMQQLAFLSELAYTLAIAAVLTKGDLPVDTVSPVQK